METKVELKIDQFEVETDNEVLEVSPEVIESDGREQDLDVDYEKTRAKYYELLDKGTEAL